jgi:uncharacterized membrane protein YdfJ with MMPL/SSD domain
MEQPDVPLILLGLVLLATAIAHRLLVPALGLVVGARAWWPPAPPSSVTPPRQRPTPGTAPTTSKIPADVTHVWPQPC